MHSKTAILQKPLNINKDLMTTAYPRAQLKELWYCESEVHAKGLWDTVLPSTRED